MLTGSISRTSLSSSKMRTPNVTVGLLFPGRSDLLTIELFPDSISILTSSASTVNDTFDVSYSSHASSAVALNLNSHSSISFPLMKFVERLTVTFIPCTVVEFLNIHVPLEVFFIQSLTVIRSLSLSVAFVVK